MLNRLKGMLFGDPKVYCERCGTVINPIPESIRYDRRTGKPTPIKIVWQCLCGNYNSATPPKQEP